MKNPSNEQVMRSRVMAKAARSRAIIQGATAAGKIVIAIHNGAPHFASWNAEKGEVEYTPCPRRNPQARFVFAGLNPKVPQ